MESDQSFTSLLAKQLWSAGILSPQ